MEQRKPHLVELMTNAVESCKSTVCTTETNFYKELHQNRNASILSTETHCAASSLGCRRFVLRPKYPSLATLLSLSRRGAVFAAVLSVADLQLCQTLALKLQNFFSSLTYIGKYLAHF